MQRCQLARYMDGVWNRLNSDMQCKFKCRLRHARVDLQSEISVYSDVPGLSSGNRAETGESVQELGYHFLVRWFGGLKTEW
ncbi:hypothetical protein BJY04DRAFT_45951 [Aspergillus karnatakaensis]|uniref:uncharacterized protein n=1 Tax=Aspergillus karnatakaensis TaxID=1810916 RepID=UPI003CCCE2CC